MPAGTVKAAELLNVCVPCAATDCLAWAGSTPESNSGLSHFEGKSASAAAPIAAPKIFIASRRESFFSVIDRSSGTYFFVMDVIIRGGGKVGQ
jgi:hypothetical protein